ncbi:MAG: hypothetical protein OXG37_13200 [Actinomycetia bacterium]|nr:hypothetical protein [Actinomycetes bacterium]
MHYIAAGIGLLVVLIIVFNTNRWRRLAESARKLKKGVETGLDADEPTAAKSRRRLARCITWRVPLPESSEPRSRSRNQRRGA